MSNAKKTQKKQKTTVYIY